MEEAKAQQNLPGVLYIDQNPHVLQSPEGCVDGCEYTITFGVLTLRIVQHTLKDLTPDEIRQAKIAAMKRWDQRYQEIETALSRCARDLTAAEEKGQLDDVGCFYLEKKTLEKELESRQLSQAHNIQFEYAETVREFTLNPGDVVLVTGARSFVAKWLLARESAGRTYVVKKTSPVSAEFQQLYRKDEEFVTCKRCGSSVQRKNKEELCSTPYFFHPKSYKEDIDWQGSGRNLWKRRTYECCAKYATSTWCGVHYSYASGWTTPEGCESRRVPHEIS